MSHNAHNLVCPDCGELDIVVGIPVKINYLVPQLEEWLEDVKKHGLSGGKELDCTNAYCERCDKDVTPMWIDDYIAKMEEVPENEKKNQVGR